MLTDSQIENLSKKMNIPYAGCYFKDELPEKINYNKSYFVNLQNSEDYNGNDNEGTHWTLLQCNKYPNGKIESFFFDPYGAEPSENIKRVVKNTTGKNGLPHSNKDIQSLMNNACGFYCLALSHFINAYDKRSLSLYTDCNDFLDMFDDLNTSIDFKKNEYILLHFFRDSDPTTRKEIDNIKPINSITGEDEAGQ
jgi:hypothetical protein